MSKEVGKMVRSRDVVQAEGSARPESVPTGRRPGRAPWRAGAAVERQPEARRGAAAAARRIAGARTALRAPRASGAPLKTRRRGGSSGHGGLKLGCGGSSRRASGRGARRSKRHGCDGDRMLRGSGHWNAEQRLPLAMRSVATMSRDVASRRRGAVSRIQRLNVSYGLLERSRCRATRGWRFGMDHGQSVSVRRGPQADPVLGDPPQFRPTSM